MHARSVSRYNAIAAAVPITGCHTARCMIGAFTQRESNAAEKLLGIPISNRHRVPSPLERVRLLCVDHFARLFTTLNPIPSV